MPILTSKVIVFGSHPSYIHTVDGRNQLRLVVYPITYEVLYILGGCLGFIPSTVLFIEMSQNFNVHPAR